MAGSSRGVEGLEAGTHRWDKPQELEKAVAHFDATQQCKSRERRAASFEVEEESETIKENPIIIPKKNI